MAPGQVKYFSAQTTNFGPLGEVSSYEPDVQYMTVRSSCVNPLASQRHICG